MTSRHNPLILELKELRKESTPKKLILEGRRLIEEAVRSGLQIEQLLVTDKIVEPLEPTIRSRIHRILPVSESVMNSLSDLDSPPGLLAIAWRPASDWKAIFQKKPAIVVILDGIQDPGNAAAIARSAEAAGAAGLVTTPATAGLFSPKALRGAMGSTFRLPCVEHQPVPEIAKRLKEAGFEIVGAQGRGACLPAGRPGTPYSDLDWKKPWALVLGQEGQGLSKEWSGHLSAEVVIPMKAPVESLNVGAAAAVLLFEAARQRASSGNQTGREHV